MWIYLPAIALEISNTIDSRDEHVKHVSLLSKENRLFFDKMVMAAFMIALKLSTYSCDIVPIVGYCCDIVCLFLVIGSFIFHSFSTFLSK